MAEGWERVAEKTAERAKRAEAEVARLTAEVAELTTALHNAVDREHSMAATLALRDAALSETKARLLAAEMARDLHIAQVEKLATELASVRWEATLRIETKQAAVGKLVELYRDARSWPFIRGSGLTTTTEWYRETENNIANALATQPEPTSTESTPDQAVRRHAAAMRLTEAIRQSVVCLDNIWALPHHDNRVRVDIQAVSKHLESAIANALAEIGDVLTEDERRLIEILRRSSTGSTMDSLIAIIDRLAPKPQEKE